MVKRYGKVTEKQERDKRKGLAGEILWPYSEIRVGGGKVRPWPPLQELYF